jgi:hypothetical protein
MSEGEYKLSGQPVTAPPFVKRQSEKDEWLQSLDLKNKGNILFELEVLLKGLDRFFNLANLPLANMEQVVTLDFSEEVRIVQDFIDRVAELSGKLLEASRREDYQFRHYVGHRLLGDYERTRWAEAVLQQRTPVESLFVLFSTFSNLRELVKGLAMINQVPYSIFFNLGSMISREILANRYFNPTSSLKFQPEYDKVTNRRIGKIIRAIDNQHLQKQVSLIVLAFHRLLRYLDYIDRRRSSIEAQKSSLLFFSLIYSESKYLKEYIENNLPRNLQGVEHEKTQEVLDVCDSLAFQIQMEINKIHNSELAHLSKSQDPDFVKTCVENSHGILANFFQQSIIQILKVFEPQLMEESVFPGFITHRIDSLQLRQDLAVFQALMDKFEEILETTSAGTSLETYIKYLRLQKGWIAKLRRDSVPLMRYHDFIEFDKYFRFIEETTEDDLENPDVLDKFKMDTKFFKIFLETTLGQIDNRTCLQDKPLDRKKVERTLKHFIEDVGKNW